MYTIANIRPIGHNVGNQAINFALRHMLYETFGRLVSIIDYPATNKHESTAKSGLTSSTIHEINRYADGVIVGGGNLFENDEIDVDARALKALQPPLMLFSNSRGRIFDRRGNLSDRSDVIPDSKLSNLLDRSDLSLSRDSATHEHLHNINSKDQLGWCPTINLSRYTESLPELPENEDAGALISIRTPSLMNVPYRFQSDIQKQIEMVIDRLREVGHKRIRILCNDSRDLDFATAFRYTKQVDSVYTSDVYQYLALLRKADIVVSYRLHATLPAMSYGVPTVNIVYDERALSLFNDLGLKSCYLNMVEQGDDFMDQLLAEVDRGGVSSSDLAGVTKQWGNITNTQFEQLSRFKSMMEAYVNTGRVSG
ncbi:polysaccharide pyruvyl transferase family protein [Marinobacter sp. CHS3-4]|uniref:polysaccharide pyruvyl transferase family protein n=1 Tax=Marinobacter sp. CHS3-4 TaxID=3045174 RepID=UPI0024B49692|nr:polysaccharide pyruvyl transferase family protein [Marinobacter sp. CHS3-4]MDI9244973.1 polysaccharide pyruvyl transferase family protein [Marinobacter sp. CHS3-4]